MSDITFFDVGRAYHLWYYENEIWKQISWLGTPVFKSVSDMWNYQEILYQLKPTLVIEFGTCHGGSTLFFATALQTLGYNFKILSVDITHELVTENVKRHPSIELLLSSSTEPQVADRISRLKREYPGRIFAILDSDHSKQHVFQEMLLLRPLLQAGDYLIVEDSNINGHPVSPGWGEGPYEAMEEYFSLYPDDYLRDEEREQKFGFSFATRGFLIRRESTRRFLSDTQHYPFISKFSPNSWVLTNVSKFELWEDFYDSLVVAERTLDPRESLKEVRQRLIQQGKLKDWQP